MEKKLLSVKLKKEIIVHHENEREIELMEKELARIEGSDAVSEAPISERRLADPVITLEQTDNALPSQILEILNKQNTISATIADCQQKSVLPKKIIQCFDGDDKTKYKTFKLNFKRNIESKCGNDSDKLCAYSSLPQEEPRNSLTVVCTITEVLHTAKPSNC